MRLIAAALLLSLLPVAHAAVVPVPDTLWGINLDLPDPGQAKGRAKGPNFSYETRAGNLFVTLFVEKPGNRKTSHADVYEYYWPRAARNPLIDQSSVRMTEQPGFVRVEYFYRGVVEGSPVSIKNLNYYFMHEGKWVDLHLSVSRPSAADDETIARFEAALKPVSLEAKPAGVATAAPSSPSTLKTLNLDPDHSVSYALAPGWEQSQKPGPDNAGTRMVLLKKDAATEIQLLFAAITPESPLALQAKPEDMLAYLHRRSCAQYIAGSVEGENQAKPWQADGQVGLESSFTDSAYGNRPAPEGEFRVVTRITAVVGPIRSGVLVSAVLLSQDLDGRDFLAMKAMIASMTLGGVVR